MHKRLVGVIIFVFVLFFLLLVEFYKIQILEGDKWTKQANLQHKLVVDEPAMRGRFFANTQALVLDVPKFHLFVDPSSIPSIYKKEIIANIFYLANVAKDKRKKVFLEFFKKSRSRKVVSLLDGKEHDAIQKWWFDYAKKRKIAKNSLYFVLDYKRSYPFGSFLGQVLHTLQEEKDPKTGQNCPTGGLEMHFNSYLAGKNGKRVILRSPRHPLEEGKILVMPEHGSDIYLTINHYIQAIAEEELEKGVKNAHAKGGWAVMIDPNSGEILCLAQYPFFDLRKYSSFFNDKNLEEHTRLKAVTDAFEPGSVFKPLTLAICLKANEELIKRGEKPLFSPYEKISTKDGHLPGSSHSFHDGSRIHYYLNMFLAVQKSSNVYISKLIKRVIDRMGEKWFRNAVVEVFNLGEKTRIEFPSETSGVMPSFGKIHPNGKLEWSLLTPYTIAIGHNILLNSIQLIRCYAIIANGGYEIKPTLVKKIVKKEGEVVFERMNSERKRLLSKESSALLMKAMKYVTKIGGTSPGGDIMGYSEGGKSGTSEKIINGEYSKQKYISSFVGFAPSKSPRFVLLVVVDEPKVGYLPGVGKIHHGGACAAPIFREIGRRSLQYLGVEIDDPFGYPVGDHRRDAKRADWAEEVKNLVKLYKEWNAK